MNANANFLLDLTHFCTLPSVRRLGSQFSFIVQAGKLPIGSLLQKNMVCMF